MEIKCLYYSGILLKEALHDTKESWRHNAHLIFRLFHMEHQVVYFCMYIEGFISKSLVFNF